MKFCGICREKNPRVAKFCWNCGNPFVAENVQSTNQRIVRGGNFALEQSVMYNRKLLNKALVAYESEYLAFKKKWNIIIYLSLVPYLVPAMIPYFLYKLYIKPEYEHELVKRYKKEHNLL